MDHFYVTLPWDSSAYYFPANTIPNFRRKLASPLELQPNKWEVRLVEIIYPKGYKKRFLHNTIRLDSEDITFPVKHYETLLDLLPNIPQLLQPSIKENIIRIFSEYINKNQEQSNELFNSCRRQNSIVINEKLVSFMNPTNWRTSTVTLFSKDNFDFAIPETVYIYTDIIKTNLVGESYVRLLTTLHFPSNIGYHSFNYFLYRLVDQSFIESISIRLVTNSGEDVLFEDGDIPCFVTLHFKKKSSK